ncbi:MAG: hypothetical protein KGH98_02370 [Candidatus Micrarchaeota archaeon]|nr:hypothetical protein [Candidatus Micrarchaeota archaeon]
MGLEAVLKRDSKAEGFGAARYLQMYKKRPNLSAVKLDDDGAATLDYGQSVSGAYDEFGGPRYVAVKSMTFDLFVTLYDVNKRRYYAARLLSGDSKSSEMGLFMKSAKGANFEARVIGLQNGQHFEGLGDVVDLLGSGRATLFEADLFGSERRNVAIDLKTGTTFDILTENRLYKPSERANQMTEEQFARELKITK